MRMINMETRTFGSSSADASIEHLGWQITLSADPRGPFGPTTVLASAVKNGQNISALAWKADVAREMIFDMIRRREGDEP